MIPSVGRIVHYRLTSSDASAINKRRQLGGVWAVGNPVKEDDIYPMLITRIWGEPPTATTSVQGQVFLDGNDQHWVTSVQQGEGPRQWRAA